MHSRNNDETEEAKLKAEWESISESDKENIREVLSAHERLSESDKEILNKLVEESEQANLSEQRGLKKHKLYLLLKTTLIIMVVVSAYLIIHYDILQRVLTPKEYWAHEVQTIETSVKSTEIIINNFYDGQAKWEATYDEEFDRMVSGLQKSGMDKESSINKSKEIMQDVAKENQKQLNMLLSILAQFKKELEIARQELSKYNNKGNLKSN